MCQSCTIKIDQTKSDQFAETMLKHINSASLMLMTSIGYRTGLFDALEGMAPSTSQQIAEKAKLNERYVREWLAAMVTGGIVTYDPENRTYKLPAEHAAWLTRTSELGNLSSTAQWIAEMAYLEDRIVECFEKGGGVTYDDMNRFHEIMADESDQTVVSPLFEHILPLMNGIQQRLKKGIKVLDVGCGRGHAMIALAKAFPNSAFTGYDFSQEAIDHANEQARNQDLTNVRFVTKDATTIDEQEEYDLIFTFDAVHDQATPDVVLQNIYHALRPDGIYFMQDIAGSSYVEKNMGHPLAPFLYTISTMGCMSVSLAQGGFGLGTMWGKEKAFAMLKEAGFNKVELKELEHDFINYYYIVRK